MKRKAQLAILTVLGLVLLCILIHAVLVSRDASRFAHLNELARTITIGDTFDRVMTVMGKPDAQWKHTEDIATGMDLGPGVAYRKKMNWKNPLLPFRIRQDAYNSGDLVICFGTNSQVREKRLPKGKN